MNWSPFEGNMKTSQDHRLGHCCSFALAMSLKTSLRGAFPRRPWERLLFCGGGPSSAPSGTHLSPQAVEKLGGSFSCLCPLAQSSHVPCSQECDQAVLPQHQLPSRLLVAFRGSCHLGSSQPELRKHLPRERPFREVQPPPCLLTGSPCPAGVESVLTQQKCEESFPVVIG